MVRNWLGWFAVCVIMLAPGCGHDQQLVSIAIAPTTETFGASNIPVSADAGLNVQLRALGTYIHPPVTKDITSQVTWTSNTPQMVTVTSGGLITATGRACGGALISATVVTNNHGTVSSSGALVTGTMQANVVCFTGTGPSLTVTFAGLGTGTVSSSPPGLGCDATCNGNFPSGTNVILTAAANGTFGGWIGCDSTSGSSCVVDDLIANRTVTVTFD
jgi:hypothetical protein